MAEKKKKGLLSLFSYSKNKSTSIDTAKSTIENQADQDTTKYVTKDFAEKLIREKVEDAINASLSDIEAKLEKRTIKLFGEFDEKVKGAINVFRSDVEGKIEENTIKLFNEFDEKIKKDRHDMLSSLRDEYRKQTDDLLETIKSASLVKRLNIYVIGIGSVFVIILILLSLFSYSKIKSTAKNIAMATIENQADLETAKYVTKDFAEKLIREKVEDTINVSLSDMEGKLEERTNKRFDGLEKRIKLKSEGVLSGLRAEYKKQTEDLLNTIKNNELSKGVDTNKPVRVASGKPGDNLAGHNGTTTQAKTDKQQASEDWYNKGLNELLRSNYAVAIVFFSKAIELDPKNHTAYLKRGDAFFSLKRYEKAIDDFSKTIEMGPGNFVAYGRRGDAYDKLKQYGNAIEDYNKAIVRNPLYASGYNNRGNTYYYIGQYEQAIKDYNKTIKLDPDNVVVYRNLGVAYSGLEQYEKAIKNFNNVIRLAPEDSYPYVQLSKINIVTGNYEGALDVITKALSLSLKKETKALALYIECIAKRILNIDTSKSENEFKRILQEDFITTWNLDKIESWLRNAEIDDDTKVFINKKTALLKKHLKE